MNLLWPQPRKNKAAKLLDSYRIGTERKPERQNVYTECRKSISHLSGTLGCEISVFRQILYAIMALHLYGCFLDLCTIPRVNKFITNEYKVQKTESRKILTVLLYCKCSIMCPSIKQIGSVTCSHLRMLTTKRCTSSSKCTF